MSDRFQPNCVLTSNGEVLIISDASGKLWRIAVTGDGMAKPIIFEEKDGERRAEGKA